MSILLTFVIPWKVEILIKIFMTVSISIHHLTFLRIFYFSKSGYYAKISITKAVSKPNLTEKSKFWQGCLQISETKSSVPKTNFWTYWLPHLFQRAYFPNIFAIVTQNIVLQATCFVMWPGPDHISIIAWSNFE